MDRRGTGYSRSSNNSANGEGESLYASLATGPRPAYGRHGDRGRQEDQASVDGFEDGEILPGAPPSSNDSRGDNDSYGRHDRGDDRRRDDRGGGRGGGGRYYNRDIGGRGRTSYRGGGRGRGRGRFFERGGRGRGDYRGRGRGGRGERRGSWNDDEKDFRSGDSDRFHDGESGVRRESFSRGGRGGRGMDRDGRIGRGGRGGRYSGMDRRDSDRMDLDRLGKRRREDSDILPSGSIDFEEKRSRPSDYNHGGRDGGGRRPSTEDRPPVHRDGPRPDQRDTPRPDHRD
ncbi:MAG: hypothetical protein SGBAC_000905, partial [Bacillariaceae sp.]